MTNLSLLKQNLQWAKLNCQKTLTKLEEAADALDALAENLYDCGSNILDIANAPRSGNLTDQKEV